MQKSILCADCAYFLDWETLFIATYAFSTIVVLICCCLPRMNVDGQLSKLNE